MKISDSESSSIDVFLVKCGLLLSRPNNGNVITKDNIKIEEQSCGKSTTAMRYTSDIITGIAMKIEVNIICSIKISKKKQLNFLFDTISNKS